MAPADAADQGTDTRAKKFGSSVSVELDAIEPNRLRRMVQETIEAHLPEAQFEILKAAEASEREIIGRLVAEAGGSMTAPQRRGQRS